MRKKDKLYTVNKWNRPAFMPDKNLFWGGGSSRIDYANSLLAETPSGSLQVAPTTFGFNNATLSKLNMPYVNWRDPRQSNLATSISQGTINTFSAGNNDIAGNFGKGNFSKPTLFTNNNGPTINSTDAGSFFNIDLTLNPDKNAGKNTSSTGKGAAWQAAGAAALNAASAVDTGDRNGLFDTLDPVYHLAGGRESKVGNALSDTGVSLTKTGNPWLMLAGAGLKIVGGLTNAAFGIKENTGNVNLVNQNIDTANSTGRMFGQATTNSDLLDLSGRMATGSGFKWNDLYENGWFTSEGTNKGNTLLGREKASLAYQNNALTTATNSVDSMNDYIKQKNTVAFGGPLFQANNDNMSAIDYSFMSDYMTLKKQQTEAKNKLAGISPMPALNTFSDGGGIHIKHPGRLTALKERTGKTEAELYNDGNPAHKKMVVFARNARKWKHADGGPLNTLYQEEIPLFAFGGDLQTNGADFPTKLTHIDAGGSHSENPYDGVQLGVDPQGVPNLVEEKETVWNDYVFSNRIEADEETRKKFHLPKKAKLTYADISKKLEKEISEHPNDPISEAGFKAQMQDLADQQERQKQEMEAARAREAFEALSPEEQTAIMQQKALEEQAMMNQAAQEQAIAEQQAMQQPSPEEAAMMQADDSQAMIGEEPQIAAYGGKINKFKEGGAKKTQKNVGTWKNDKENHWDVFTKPGLKRYLENLKQKLAMAPNDEVKEEIRKEAMNELNSLQQSYFSHVLPSAGADKYEYSEDILNHQKMFDRLYGNTGFYTTDENGNVRNLIAEAINLPNGAATEDKPENWADGYNGRRTSIRNFGSTEYGDDKYYQDLVDEFADLGLTYAPNENWKYGDNQLYGLSLSESEPVKEEKPKVWDWGTRGWIDEPSTVAATTTVKPSVTQKDEEEETAPPKHRSEWMRYAGLFGPAAGLGLMAAGVGKPDYNGLDAAVASSGNVARADYKPIGDYLRYRPLDIWYAQNRMDANARATDRTLMNSGVNQGSKMAGLLANGYNSQMGSGELFRQAQEYNDALRERAATFNRGTNQFNSEAYNRTSQFNAAARNQANQTRSQIALQAAREKLEGDAGWYNSLYGNIGNLFKGISDLGRENAQWNMIADNAADGVFGNLGTSYTGQRVLDTKKTKRSKGGNIKKKKGLTY